MRIQSIDIFLGMVRVLEYGRELGGRYVLFKVLARGRRIDAVYGGSEGRCANGVFTWIFEE